MPLETSTPFFLPARNTKIQAIMMQDELARKHVYIREDMHSDPHFASIMQDLSYTMHLEYLRLMERMIWGNAQMASIRRAQLNILECYE
jgi:hypothetical protein